MKTFSLPARAGATDGMRWSPGRTLGKTAAAAALALGLVAPAVSQAAPCSSLPNPLYGQGGSAHVPLLSKVGKALSNFDPPRTLIYQAPGACVGLNTLVAGATGGSATITGTASYWDSTGAEQTCDLPIVGQKIDFAAAGVYAPSCEGIAALPAGLGDFTGVIGSWNVLVPNASTQQNISSEALYFIFGFGAAGNVAPWTDETQYYVRNATSAVQIAVALAAGLPPGKVLGIDTKKNQDTVNKVAASPTPEKAIGFTSGEVADLNRDVVRTLAYQHVGQNCAYWPDSTATAFDKVNVRNGQYFLWSPTHFYAPVDANGIIIDPKVKEFIGWFTGTVPTPPELPLLDIQIENGNIPKCAMNVDRDGDSGPLYSYQPDEPCGCYFEFKATGSTTCQACSSNADCTGSAKTCRLGYCEVK